ncbi:MAG: histidine phosphatase family protein [Actinomycetota bacterium]|nr:histidine phosphatase family protein [Actinomycetota bacterium]
MRVHFLRHGQSASNAAPGVVSLPEAEGDRLSERGWEQARAAGEQLSGIAATRILTSPLRRARETAEALAERLGLPIVEVEELREIRESDGYDVLPAEEQLLRRWSVWMAEHPDDRDHSRNGGESFNEVMGRVERLQQLLVGSGEETALAVSHGIFLRFFFIHSLLGDEFGPGQVRRLWQLHSINCGLCSFEHREPGSRDPAQLDQLAFAAGRWRCLTWMSRWWDPLL